MNMPEAFSNANHFVIFIIYARNPERSSLVVDRKTTSVVFIRGT
ncbi:hypothetical protein ASZ90_015033 [hydrocarbon metagenome]|uniref:Uncharacterized protein n=1 Tax=hydrocarbon metagenome TaxID=938273 RepID=A0A0W8F338_9ZZZZ